MKQTRRNFLKTSAAVAAIAALPSIAFATGEAEPARSMAIYFEEAAGGTWFRVAVPEGDDALYAYNNIGEAAVQDSIKTLTKSNMIVHRDAEDGKGRGSRLHPNEGTLKSDQITDAMMVQLHKLPITKTFSIA